MATPPRPADPDAAIDGHEWVFAAWTADGSLAVVCGHRIVGPTIWYWSALARAGRPLLHVADFEVRRRADPFVIKGASLWAEHRCEAADEQWSIGNETYAVALDDPADALGSAYGVPTPIAMDLEWYATAPPSVGATGTTVTQDGVVHGRIDVLGEPPIELAEVPARRWEGTGPAATFPLAVAHASAHRSVRTVFAFPDGRVDDLVLTPSGWGRRRSTDVVPF